MQRIRFGFLVLILISYVLLAEETNTPIKTNTSNYFKNVFKKNVVSETAIKTVKQEPIVVKEIEPETIEKQITTPIETQQPAPSEIKLGSTTAVTKTAIVNNMPQKTTKNSVKTPVFSFNIQYDKIEEYFKNINILATDKSLLVPVKKVNKTYISQIYKGDYEIIYFDETSLQRKSFSNITSYSVKKDVSGEIFIKDKAGKIYAESYNGFKVVLNHKDFQGELY